MTSLNGAVDILAGAAVIITAVCAAIVWAVRVLKGFIRDEIAEATQQIHPKANGGKSLNDIADCVRATNSKVDTLAVRFDDHIAYHTGKEPK